MGNIHNYTYIYIYIICTCVYLFVLSRRSWIMFVFNAQRDLCYADAFQGGQTQARAVWHPSNHATGKASMLREPSRNSERHWIRRSHPTWLSNEVACRNTRQAERLQGGLGPRAIHSGTEPLPWAENLLPASFNHHMGPRHGSSLVDLLIRSYFRLIIYCTHAFIDGKSM